MDRIVVGVDGSPGSRAAFRWAVDEGRARRCRVEAVHAWHVPSALYPIGVTMPDLSIYEDAARVVLDQVVDGTDTRGLPAPVDRIVVCGTAWDMLIDASKGAEMLVVGSRGLGAVAGMVMGSVSSRCVHRAHCTVVVVREAHDSPET
jgi:nucleotide-binding universal stress UspA family protein